MSRSTSSRPVTSLIAADERIDAGGPSHGDEVVVVTIAAGRRPLVWIIHEVRMVPDGAHVRRDQFHRDPHVEPV